jgi:hypothetical protein
LVVDVGLIISLLAIAISLYTGVIRPWRAAKPELTYSADHYFITEDTASHDLLIWNKGNAPAKNIGLDITLQKPFKIKEFFTNPQAEVVSGGKGESSLRLSWKELPPKNYINVKIMSEAAKEKPQTAYPAEFKLWHEGGLVNSYILRPSET